AQDPPRRWGISPPWKKRARSKDAARALPLEPEVHIKRMAFAERQRSCGELQEGTDRFLRLRPIGLPATRSGIRESAGAFGPCPPGAPNPATASRRSRTRRGLCHHWLAPGNRQGGVSR